MRRLILISALMVLACVIAPRAALAWTVTSSVNRQTMTTGDELMLTVTVKDAEGTVDTSPITDFRIVNTMRSTSTRIVNGVRSALSEYHFQLAPKGHGVLSIPPLAVRVGGQTFRTNLIRIQVQEQQTDSTRDSDIFIKARASRTSVWMGEEFVYDYALYNRARLLGGQSHPPSFEGFSAHEMPAQEGRENLDGRDFAVSLWPFLLSPTRTGVLTIEPAVVECQVARRRAGGAGSLFDQFFSGGMFGGDPFGSTIDHRTISSNPVEIEVKPLPRYTGKGVFSGLVGRFDIAVRVDKDTLETGDSATLSVEISGKGNLYDVSGPELTPPDGLKMYADAPEENIKAGPDGTTGSKVFRWALVPLKPGTYTLGPFPLNYFDVDQGRYVSVFGGPMHVTVTGEPAPERPRPDAPKGAPHADADTLKAGGGDAARVTDNGAENILPLMDGPDAVLDAGPQPVWLFILLLLVPPCGYVALCFGVRLRERAGTGGRVMAARARASLRQAGREKDDSGAVLGHLARAVVYAVRARAGAPGESLTRDEVLDLLGGDDDAAREACALLEDIEAARWSGEEPGSGGLEKLRARVSRLLRRLAV